MSNAKVKLSQDFPGNPKGQKGVWTFRNLDTDVVYHAEGKYEDAVGTLPDGEYILHLQSEKPSQSSSGIVTSF